MYWCVSSDFELSLCVVLQCNTNKLGVGTVRGAEQKMYSKTFRIFTSCAREVVLSFFSPSASAAFFFSSHHTLVYISDSPVFSKEKRE